MIYHCEYTEYGEPEKYPPLITCLVEAGSPEQAYAACDLLAQEGVAADEDVTEYSLDKIELLEEAWNERMLKPIIAQSVLERRKV